MRYLFVSPHLDDVTLSCGAYIARLIPEGNEVMVVSCFTSPGSNARNRLEKAYQQRIIDDCCALSHIGASYYYLNLTDAPFRSRYYNNFNTLLFHHRLPEYEQTVLDDLITKLKNLAAEWFANKIFFPLGVGGHIDHHLVWEASKAFIDGPYPVTFYEEQPYSFLTGWSSVRWSQLGAQATLQQGQQLPKIALSGSPYPFVHNYVTSPEDWSKSTDKYNAEFTDYPVDTLQWDLNGRIFDRIQWEADEKHLRLKSQGILEYTSEWPVLFGPDKDSILETLKQPAARETGWTFKTGL